MVGEGKCNISFINTNKLACDPPSPKEVGEDPLVTVSIFRRIMNILFGSLDQHEETVLQDLLVVLKQMLARKS